MSSQSHAPSATQITVTRTALSTRRSTLARGVARRGARVAPLGIAFAVRSARAERWAGLAVVLAIFVSACVAGYEAIYRVIEPSDVDNLGALAAAGVIGFIGNWITWDSWRTVRGHGHAR